MNFWNDPKYSAVRVLLIVLIVLGAGYFVYTSGVNAGNKASVFDSSASPLEIDGPVTDGEYMSCAIKVTHDGNGKCEIQHKNCTTEKGVTTSCFEEDKKTRRTDCCRANDGVPYYASNGKLKAATEDLDSEKMENPAPAQNQ